MIIWLNGAFGSGKTTCAKKLQSRLLNAYLYDPEEAGFFIRANLPESLQEADFQQHPEWRTFNYMMLAKIAASYDGVIIVPMTLVHPTYVDDIIGRLQRDGVTVRHLLLRASKRTLERRLNKRFEWFNSWGKQQIDRCLDAFAHDIDAETIPTDDLSADAVVDAVIRRIGLI